MARIVLKTRSADAPTDLQAPAETAPRVTHTVAADAPAVPPEAEVQTSPAEPATNAPVTDTSVAVEEVETARAAEFTPTSATTAAQPASSPPPASNGAAQSPRDKFVARAERALRELATCAHILGAHAGVTLWRTAQLSIEMSPAFGVLRELPADWRPAKLSSVGSFVSLSADARKRTRLVLDHSEPLCVEHSEGPYVVVRDRRGHGDGRAQVAVADLREADVEDAR